MNSSHHFPSWFPLAVAVLCVSTVGAGAASPLASYWPCATGNTWTFKVTQLAEMGPGYTEVMKITGTYAHAGATWWALEETGERGGPLTTWYRYDAVGLLQYTTENPTPEYILKSPLTTGASWVMSTGGDVAHYTITSLAATTTVPAGTFRNCLLLTITYSAPSTMKNYKLTYWWVPNKGMVRWQENSGTTIILTGVLKSCVIK